MSRGLLFSCLNLKSRVVPRAVLTASCVVAM